MSLREPRTAGRVAGALLLTQMAVTPVAHFKLLAPAMSAPPGFLANAASHATQVHTAVLLMVFSGMCTLAFAAVVHQVLARYERSVGLVYVVLAGVGLALACAEGAALRAMLALSEAYVVADTPGAAAAFEPARVTLRGLRNSLHYLHLLTAGVSLILLYAGLGGFRLVPRWLGVLGVATAALLLPGAILPLLGHATVMKLFMPMGISQLLLAGWLVVRGFAPASARTESTA